MFGDLKSGRGGGFGKNRLVIIEKICREDWRGSPAFHAHHSLFLLRHSTWKERMVFVKTSMINTLVANHFLKRPRSFGRRNDPAPTVVCGLKGGSRNLKLPNQLHTRGGWERAPTHQTKQKQNQHAKSQRQTPQIAANEPHKNGNGLTNGRKSRLRHYDDDSHPLTPSSQCCETGFAIPSTST